MIESDAYSKSLDDFDVDDIGYPGQGAHEKQIFNGLLSIEEDGKDLNVKFDGRMLGMMLQPYAKSKEDSFDLLLTRYINKNSDLLQNKESI